MIIKNFKLSEFKDTVEQDIEDYKYASLRKLNECIPVIEICSGIIDSWLLDNNDRGGKVTYEHDYNWDTNGFTITLELSKEDSIRSTSPHLRPLKYSKLVKFDSKSADSQNAQLSAFYKIVGTERLVELKINLNKSVHCKRVKTGSRVVDTYSIECDDSIEIAKELEFEELEK